MIASTRMHFSFFVLLVAGALALVQIDFTIHGGDSVLDMEIDKRPRIVKRDNLTLALENKAMFYLASIKIGSNKQEIDVLIDTGSSDLWIAQSGCSKYNGFKRNGPLDDLLLGRPGFEAHEKEPAPTPTQLKAATTLQLSRPSYTYPSIYSSLVNCSQYGSFLTAGLDTFQVNDTSQEFYVSYGDGTYAWGFWANDDVEFSGTTLSSLSFGVCPYTDSEVGVLGIGLQGLESSYSNFVPGGYFYENMPMLLKSQGVIAANAYSIWLGKNNVSEGSILFGAVDHSKYTGSLQMVQMVNRYTNVGYKNPIRTEIILDSILGDGLNVQFQTSALLDTGTSLTHLPRTYVSALVSMFGGSYYGGYYEVTCALLSLNDTLTFTFSGVDIPVPVKDLIIKSTSGMSCFLGVVSSGDAQAILGDNFLRSTYMVFDLDNYLVSLAQAADESSSSSNSSIEAITSGIPGALQAPNFLSTTLSRLAAWASGSSSYYVSTRTFGSANASNVVPTTNKFSSGSARAVSATSRRSSSSSSSSTGGSLTKSGDSRNLKVTGVVHVLAGVLFGAVLFL